MIVDHGILVLLQHSVEQHPRSLLFIPPIASDHEEGLHSITNGDYASMSNTPRSGTTPISLPTSPNNRPLELRQQLSASLPAPVRRNGSGSHRGAVDEDHRTPQPEARRSAVHQMTEIRSVHSTPRTSHKLKSTLPAPLSPAQTVIVTDSKHNKRLSVSPNLGHGPYAAISGPLRTPQHLRDHHENVELSPTPRPLPTMRSVSVKIKSRNVMNRSIISPKRTASGHHPSASMNTHAPLNHWAVCLYIMYLFAVWTPCSDHVMFS